MKKRVFCLVVIVALLAVPTCLLAGTGTDLLDNLPFENYIMGDVRDASDCNLSTIVVFGRVTCSNTMSYLPTANTIVANKWSNQIDILFFDVDQSPADVSNYFASHRMNEVSVFTGGHDVMWDLLLSNGYANSIVFPVVAYIDTYGDIVHVTTDYQNSTSITSTITQFMGGSSDFGDGDDDGDVDDNNDNTNYTDAAQVSVLANNGSDFAERKQAIEDYWQAVKASVPTGQSIYQVAPHTTAPYSAGSLKDEVTTYGEKTLNFYRFLAGLPDDVQTTTELNDLTQHGALLMVASSYGHTPPKPAGMDQALYEYGYQSTSSSNIAFGYGNLSLAIQGWMKDEDSGNIDRIGHRRWFLNPTMQYTGFGQVNALYNAYSFDRSRSNVPEYEAIAYPAGSAFPSGFFTGQEPWSITMNPAYYETPDRNSVKVKLVGGGKTVNFSTSSSSLAGNYFNIDLGGYGVSNCIIFRPSGVSSYTGEYQVEVTGLKTRDGADAELSYTVQFFDMTGVDTKEVVAKPATAKPTTPQINKTNVSYISGIGRVETSIAISQKGWASADTVIIAPGGNNNLIDALAVAPFAGQEDAPILLCLNDTLSPAVITEIERLGASKAYVIGALSQNVINQLCSKIGSIDVEAIKGQTRWETAALINAKVQTPQGVFLIGYNAIPDAVSVAAFAAANGYIIQLADSNGQSSAINTSFATSYIVGGPTLVRDQPGFTRIYGADRYATNRALGDALDFEYETVYTADGLTLVDALTGSVLAAKTRSMIVLTPNNDPSFIDYEAITPEADIYGFGGAK
jgi:hypothetical protein